MTNQKEKYIKEENNRTFFFCFYSIREDNLTFAAVSLLFFYLCILLFMSVVVNLLLHFLRFLFNVYFTFLFCYSIQFRSDIKFQNNIGFKKLNILYMYALNFSFSLSLSLYFNFSFACVFFILFWFLGFVCIVVFADFGACYSI